MLGTSYVVKYFSMVVYSFVPTIGLIQGMDTYYNLLQFEENRKTHEIYVPLFADGNMYILLDIVTKL